MNFTNEQAQLRTLTNQCWNHLNLDLLVPQLAADVHKASCYPSCVVLLLDDERAGESTPEIEALIQQRLSHLRTAVEQGGWDYALGNQPQYVVDRVMAHEVPEGWTKGQYKVGDLPCYTSLTLMDIAFIKAEAAKLRSEGWADPDFTARQIVDNAWRSTKRLRLQFKQHLIEVWLKENPA